MNNSHVFNSDYFIATMFDTISPIYLYHLRYITKYLYTNVTIENINKKIINNIKLRLKYQLGNDYNIFMETIKNRNICIYGPFVTEAIWEEYHINTYIDIKMLDINMGTESDNVFIDLKMPNVYNQVNNVFMYDSDFSIIIDNIRLYIISDNNYDYYETFPIIFQNTLLDKLKITDIKAVMNKQYFVSDYYYSWFFKEQETEQELCDKYNLKRLF